MTGRPTTSPTRALGFVAATILGVGCADAGTLDAIVRREDGRQVLPIPGVHYVEPFDYHYPDEGFYDDVDDRVRVVLARGEYESGTFVFVPETNGEIVATVGALASADGTAELSPGDVSIGVVLYRERGERTNRLDMGWLGGIRRQSTGQDPRGFHQDRRERSPVVPTAIVSDQIAIESLETSDEIILQVPVFTGARARGQASLGTQFWITVHAPEALEMASSPLTLEGTITLEHGGTVRELPLTVEVHDVALDPLADHGRAVGVMHSLERTPAEFRSAMLADFSAHGVNAVRDPVDPTEYASLGAVGVTTLLNSAGRELRRVDREAADAAGLEPFKSHGLFEPTPAEVQEAIEAARTAHANGFLYADAMRWAVLQEIAAAEPVDLWLHALTTYELDDQDDAEFDGFLDHLDAVREDPTAKVATQEGHYAEVFNGHDPLQARVLYGFWLFRSNLDAALAWGHARLQTQNPFADVAYRGVVFPVLEEQPDGSTTPRIFSSYTWEAFREGIDDLRYALTVDRLLRERGSTDQRGRFDALLQPYGPLYDALGNRVDYRNRESDVRFTRERLRELLIELSRP